MNDTRMTIKGVNMRTTDWDIVRQVRYETGLESDSATLRHIIREREKLQQQVATLRAMLWQLAKDTGADVPDLLEVL